MTGVHLRSSPVHACTKEAGSPEPMPQYQPNTSLVTQWTDHATEPSRKSSHMEGPASSSKTTAFTDVPDEIMDAILVHAVRGHGDLRTIAATCRRWHSFSQQDCTWKRMAIRGWGHRADIVQVPINKEGTMGWKEYYMTRLQTHLPELSYMKFQEQMTVSIRSILINWLLAVIDELQENTADYLPAAHHQTVAYFDRYCASLDKVLETNELQMIGAACAVMALHVGQRVDDIDMTFFSRAAFYTDGACTEDQVLAVAHNIMQVFGEETLPTFETACDYIDELLTTMQKNFGSSSTFCLAHYLGELALQAETSLKFSSREIGTAAYALACHTLGWGETLWMPIIKHHSPKITLQAMETSLEDLHALLRQALSMLTRRNKRTSLPHVIVKYSRRERQHVAKVILTDSPWPASCPHGVLRATHEPCQECIDADAQALEQEGEEQDVMGVGEEAEEHDASVEAAAVQEQSTEQEVEVAGDGAAAAEEEDDEEEAHTAAEEVAALANLSTSIDQEDDADEVAAGPTESKGGFSAPLHSQLQVVAVASKLDDGGRHAVHTPVNATETWTAPDAPETGPPVVLGSGSAACAAAAAGDGEDGAALNCRRCPEHGGGLQDVSFGVMSDACDNSFVSATSPEAADLLSEDRRMSMGGDRRTSLGSVLGAVFEEMPAVEDTMPFECASCAEAGCSPAASVSVEDIGLKAMPGSGDGGEEWGREQLEASAVTGAVDGGDMWTC